MKNLLTLFVLPVFLMASQVNPSFAGEKEKDIPKLQNPVSVSYIKENLTKSKPRMVFNQQLVEDLKEKIKTDPVIGNLYEAIRLDAYEILDLPVMKRVKTSNAMLEISREMLRRVNMLGVVYLVERDQTILERIDREVLATCRFSDWNPPVYLDTGEISMAVALALDWTCDQLPETTIRTAKRP